MSPKEKPGSLSSGSCQPHKTCVQSRALTSSRGGFTPSRSPGGVARLPLASRVPIQATRPRPPGPAAGRRPRRELRPHEASCGRGKSDPRLPVWDRRTQRRRFRCAPSSFSSLNRKPAIQLLLSGGAGRRNEPNTVQAAQLWLGVAVARFEENRALNETLRISRRRRCRSAALTSNLARTQYTLTSHLGAVPALEPSHPARARILPGVPASGFVDWRSLQALRGGRGRVIPMVAASPRRYAFELPVPAASQRGRQLATLGAALGLRPAGRALGSQPHSAAVRRHRPGTNAD